MNQDNMKKVNYKVYLCAAGFEPEIRRMTIHDDISRNYFYLKQRLVAIFPALKETEFTVSWKDREGDTVRICSDEELVIALSEMESQDFKKIYVSTTPKRDNEGPIHPNVVCDGCEGTIQGFRYKCIVCVNFDLCPDCERSQLHPDHPMIRIPLPVSLEESFSRRFFHRMSKNMDHIYEASDRWEKKGRGDCKREKRHSRGASGGGCPMAGVAAEVMADPINGIFNLLGQFVGQPEGPPPTNATGAPQEEEAGASGGGGSQSQGQQKTPRPAPGYDERKFHEIIRQGITSFLDPLGGSDSGRRSEPTKAGGPNVGQGEAEKKEPSQPGPQQASQEPAAAPQQPVLQPSQATPQQPAPTQQSGPAQQPAPTQQPAFQPWPAQQPVLTLKATQTQQPAFQPATTQQPAFQPAPTQQPAFQPATTQQPAFQPATTQQPAFRPASTHQSPYPPVPIQLSAFQPAPTLQQPKLAPPHAYSQQAPLVGSYIPPPVTVLPPNAFQTSTYSSFQTDKPLPAPYSPAPFGFPPINQPSSQGVLSQGGGGDMSPAAKLNSFGLVSGTGGTPSDGSTVPPPPPAAPVAREKEATPPLLDSSWTVIPNSAAQPGPAGDAGTSVEGGLIPPGAEATPSLSNSVASSVAGDKPSIYPAIPVMPITASGQNIVDETLSRLVEMGFVDKDDWLRQLVENKKGSLDEVLQFLTPIPKKKE